MHRPALSFRLFACCDGGAHEGDAAAGSRDARGEGWKRPRSFLWRGAVVVGALHLVVSFLTRVALLAQARHEVTWDSSLLPAFWLGLGFDVLAALYAVCPWWLLALLWPARLLRSRAGSWCVAGLVSVYAAVFVFIGVSEWLFWDEFQARFNFIAVDYLIWTQEVVGNIRESYPMPAILGSVGLAALGITRMLWRRGVVRWIAEGDARWWPRVPHTAGLIALATGVSLAFHEGQLPHWRNEFNRELAKNGIYSFCAAFWESSIDYDRFYRRLDLDEAFGRARSLLALADTPPAGSGARDLRRLIRHDGEERRWNIVLITVESLSGEFLAHFGNEGGLTPRLDALADESVFFTKLYATGTRTVRGLEALTLSVPPTPGQSIIWRPGNDHLFSLGTLCRARGYDTAFVYGGDAVFDNMRSFFTGNGYRVVDRAAKTSADITFQNAWGACDEDIFRWTLKEADADDAAGKPFLLHVMTVSNHRPFTFPTDHVALKKKELRQSAVRYTDYAIGDFLDRAKSKPWFGRTLFVIVADHCHGSAGHVEIDATKYQIPALVWNPALVPARKVGALCSQIDLMPTVLGLMNWSYTTEFYGQDVLSQGYGPERQRAFISSYQKIGLLTPDTLALLKPKREITLAHESLATGKLTHGGNPARVDDAVALFQTASWRFKNGAMREDGATPAAR